MIFLYGRYKIFYIILCCCFFSAMLSLCITLNVAIDRRHSRIWKLMYFPVMPFTIKFSISAILPMSRLEFVFKWIMLLPFPILNFHDHFETRLVKFIPYVSTVLYHSPFIICNLILTCSQECSIDAALARRCCTAH